MVENINKKLEKNFGRMFWIQAFLNLKVLNVISVLFYLHRGISLSQIFYLSVIWGVASLLFEIPSSYMADRWGRKKTLLFGVALTLVHWILYLFADNFIIFAIAIIFASLQSASFSGTDDALIYDTNKQLGRKKGSLVSLGKYYSARSFFKIFAPLIGAFIAKDLLEWQFIIIILLDVVATVVALVFTFSLVEPNHHVDVEEMEAGVIKDAWNLIKSDWSIIRAMISRALIFLAMFVIWRIHQKFFIDIGLSVLWLGISWSIIHLLGFIYNQNIKKFVSHKLLNEKINLLNISITITLSILVLSVVLLPNKFILLFLYSLMAFLELARWPLYSEFYNRKSKSFNRATTLSLSNFIKGIMDPIVLVTAAVLVTKNITYPFVLSLLLALVVVLFFRLPVGIIDGKKV